MSLWDEHGIWLFGFSCRVKSESVFEPELLSVPDALKLAWDKGLKKVFLESDSEPAHTLREGNFAADALTNIGISESFELQVWKHPPKSILYLILLADKIGMEVPRHGALDQIN
ncbi:hypothetical protein DKX38_026830 [Salix brachista]|uniref:RNase H type-1 domain-containing protein n=1 Tax=Salix brachista TaxID=2182728 RepID=A0A5N5JBI6_9ROSI|nr:hypothetical protein DKX38_026830 [Salix brachista]